MNSFQKSFLVGVRVAVRKLRPDSDRSTRNEIAKLILKDYENSVEFKKAIAKK